ncbi:cellulose or protein binding domain-containing protein [Saccharothrix carnea]|uniref:Cellulose or protein binding domain-containing protein n=1 Tax=Saccharothrix carnea TaxID=1280637 RepID=A0A2P8I1W6_SACCR|nr:carbohydrate-binding domain-containing protein [Saccharothrix carnea]PSL52467.1 cellulose or protein binding domain-containing protein [Saccharothrix carnea]
MRRSIGLVLGLLLAVAGSVLGAGPAVAENAPNGYPYCSSSSSDPDGDGWGWENSASCVVRGGAADTGSGSGGNAPNGYPYCANGSSSDPDGDGWGWENSRSCVVRGGAADGGSGGGGGSTACPSGMSCGSYSVSGLGYRKQQIRNAGGNSLDLAVAMLETENMSTNYAYGDNKTYDAANFGIFKQNWLMLRSKCSRFSGQSVSQWNNGAVLNSNLSADISCLHQSQSGYGLNTWFAGHRNGESGLNNPNTSDINGYKTAIYWIKSRIDSNSANLSNDTRFWVDVRPI